MKRKPRKNRFLSHHFDFKIFGSATRKQPRNCRWRGQIVNNLTKNCVHGGGSWQRTKGKNKNKARTRTRLNKKDILLSLPLPPLTLSCSLPLPFLTLSCSLSLCPFLLSLALFAPALTLSRSLLFSLALSHSLALTISFSPPLPS